MTDLTIRQQCENIKAEMNELDVKFKTYFEEVLKPQLPEFLLTMIETQVQALEEQKKAKGDLDLDLDDEATLIGFQRALETMKALCAIHNVK